jgi:hypothetical protein
VLEEAHNSQELVEQVAALDIGKAELTCCVRVPSPKQPGRRRQEVTADRDDDPLAAGAGGSAGRVGG